MRDCDFAVNTLGVSIGTRDCYNVLENCRIENNRGAGVMVRQTPRPTEVHSCRISGCLIAGNAGAGGRGQIEITSDAHDLVLTGNDISGVADKPGIFIEDTVRDIHVSDNIFTSCSRNVETSAEAPADTAPAIECGYGEWSEAIYRHLSASAQVSRLTS